MRHRAASTLRCSRSAREKGQIYMPHINWLLTTAALFLVVGFRTSSNLAAAYGFAVASTMVLTTIIFSALSTWWTGRKILAAPTT